MAVLRCKGKKIGGVAVKVGDASKVSYDNTISGISATSVQGAIDALNNVLTTGSLMNVTFVFGAQAYNGIYYSNSVYVPYNYTFSLYGDYQHTMKPSTDAIPTAEFNVNKSGNYVFLYTSNANVAGVTLSTTLQMVKK